MLRSLEVDNLAVLEHVAVSFEPGLNVVTGETGAGKSLLVDGLQLALGARAGAELVRAGRRSARVAALCEAAGPGVRAALAEIGVEPDDDDCVLLSREVGADGRAACRINGRLATATALRQAGGLLVGVVGQGDHHRFAAPTTQLAFLDAYGGPALLEARARLAELHAAWRAARAALEESGGDPAGRQARRRALEDEVHDIGEVDPGVDEEEQLQARRQALVHAERLATGVGRVLQALSEGDEPLRDRVGAVAGELEALARLHPAFAEPRSMVEQASIALVEAAHAVAGLRDAFPDDPAALHALEERWNRLQRLKRRYGDSLREVLAARDAAAAALEEMERQVARSAAAERGLVGARARLGEAAEALGALRAEAAARLEVEVTTELSELGMPAARLRIDLRREVDEGGVPVGGRQTACTATGAERAEFLWTANPGGLAVPLGRAASGGELARLVLALHALAASEADVPTIVFDEVDAGIGGRAAAAVADRLRRLARQRQVLCVTHLAVIAAAADQHFAIEKTESAAGTVTAVRRLEGRERTLEVARMLDGGLGQASLRHAEDMLRAQPR